MSSATKVCSKCGERKSADLFYARNGGARVSASCKACDNKRAAKYASQNKDVVNAIKTRWAAENSDKVMRSRRSWLLANLDAARAACSARVAKLYAANPTKFRALAKADREASPEKHAARFRRWRAANPDKVNLHVARLSRAYVANTLGMRIETVPPELIELKREQLEIYRLSKEIKIHLKELSK